MATTDIYSVTGSLHPTKHGIRFLGGDVDDGVQVDAAAAAIVAGNHTKGTFTAWIMVPDRTGTYTIFGAGDANAVEYMHISVEAGTIWVMIVDSGPSTRIDVNTAAGTIKPHHWHHIAVVQDGVRLKIYIDGNEMALTWTTETETGQWFDDLDNIDGAHIGAADSVAGGAALTNEFKGYISEVRIWSGTASACALSRAEIQSVMAGGKPQSTYLHNSWDLNTDAIDDGTGADNGTIVGALIYCDANEFTSRFSFGCGTPVTADNVAIAMNEKIGMATVIQQA